MDAFVLPRANLPSETQQTNPMTTMTPSAVWLAESSQNDDNDNEDEEHKLAIDKATKAMTAFTNKYLKNTGTKLCKDPSVAAVVVKGLAEHKVQYGAPLCPCRFYENKEAEVKNGYWNCPCVPMRERHECHCMLFLTEDNAFVGDKDVRATGFSTLPVEFLVWVFLPKLLYTHCGCFVIFLLDCRTFPTMRSLNMVVVGHEP